jgi:hypothetical protein
VGRLERYVERFQAPDGSFPNPSDSSDQGQFLTPLAIEALAATGTDPREVRLSPQDPSAVQWLADHRSLFIEATATESTTFCPECEWAKQILAIAASFGDPDNFGGFNYTQALVGLAPASVDSSRANGQIFALLALRASNVDPTNGTVASLRAAVLKEQANDGSWSGDCDLTGAALAGLTAAGVAPANASLVRAVSWLHRAQAADGSFGQGAGAGERDNLQSTAWVLWGLRSAGEDPAGSAWAAPSGQTPVSFLAGEVRSDGSLADPDPSLPAGSTASLWQSLDVLLGLAAEHRPVFAYLRATATWGGPAVAGAAENFSAESVPGATFVWQFGDGASAGGSSVAHVYSEAGAFEATVLATAGAYGANLTDLPVEIAHAPPVALISISASPYYPRANLTLSGAASTDADGVVVGFDWAFGDGQTTDWGPYPVVDHAYAKPGRYFATLRVRDTDGLESSASASVSVASAPPIVAPIPNTTATRIAPVDIVANASEPAPDTPLTYSWSYGDGAVCASTASRSRHEYTRLGTFEGRVWVRHADGNATVAPFNVSVVNLPPVLRAPRASALPTVNETIALSINATDPEGTPLRFGWDFGDGTRLTTTSASMTHRWEKPGTFDVTIAVSDADNGTSALSFPLPVSPTAARGNPVDAAGGGSNSGGLSGAASPSSANGSTEGGPRSSSSSFSSSTDGVNLSSIATWAPTETWPSQREIWLVASPSPATERSPVAIDIRGESGQYYDVSFGDGSTATNLAPHFIHSYLRAGTYLVVASAHDRGAGPDAVASAVLVVRADSPRLAFRAPLNDSVVSPPSVQVEGATAAVLFHNVTVTVWSDRANCVMRFTLSTVWNCTVPVPPAGAWFSVFARANTSDGEWGPVTSLVLRISKSASPVAAAIPGSRFAVPGPSVGLTLGVLACLALALAIAGPRRDSPSPRPCRHRTRRRPHES